MWLLSYSKQFIKNRLISNKYIILGKKFSFGKNFRCECIYNFQGRSYEPLIVFGDNVHIEDFVHIGCVNKIEIGDSTVIASNVYISDHNHGYYDYDHADLHENPRDIPPLDRMLTNDSSVILGKNVWIGENVTILPGTVIGDGAIVGANSVVKGEVDSYTISVGVPAKSIKKYDFEEGIWSSINGN